jgi:Tol biopolymer transport system component
MGIRSRVLLLALAAVLLAGCGGSAKPKGPPDLLFVSPRDGDYAIFGADAHGDHARRLTKEKGDPSTPSGLFFQTEPAWSPDGLQIAFASKREGPSHIFVMAADGSGTHRLTNGSKEDDRPAWSPDGATILFGREGALFVVPASGGKAQRVGRGLGNAANPAWSPDGKLIAYDYRDPGSAIRELWVMNGDGSGIHRLTNQRDVSAFPAWSPDGERIAFQSNAGASHYEIYTVGSDGSGVRRETHSDIDTITPAWTPGGTLTFSRDGSLQTIDASGKATELTPSDGNDSSPAWRPMRSK